MKKKIYSILSITLAFCILAVSLLSTTKAYASSGDDYGLSGSGLRDPWTNPNMTYSYFLLYNDDFYESSLDINYNSKYLYDIDYSSVSQGYEDLTVEFCFSFEDRGILATSIFDLFYQFQLLSRNGGGLSRIDSIYIELVDSYNQQQAIVFPDYSFVPKYGTFTFSAEDLTFAFDIDVIYIYINFSFDDFQYPDKVLDSNQRLELTYNSMNPPSFSGLGPLSNSLFPDGPIGGGDPDDYVPEEEDEPSWFYKVLVKAFGFFFAGPIALFKNFTEGASLRGLLTVVFGIDMANIVSTLGEIRDALQYKESEDDGGIDGITGADPMDGEAFDDLNNDKLDVDNISGDITGNIDNLIDDDTTSSYLEVIKYICTIDLVRNALILSASLAFVGFVLYGKKG